ncbi:hypothetical protein EGN72_02580 [Pseudorhodobacter sp. E13]|uniref:hypothetical protein n=1 Tax=Pseudorhodobacter sp. E13 TaxID=2487931 RepID=UPI000F8F016E|nr:hypothetical protein [Pseudorhodobacter sp. E13]RUS64897.1 hypothetical protein EGN72_02580 [Pseudorhodobacter sp. E13]
MKLPGYKPDCALAERLLELQRHAEMPALRSAHHSAACAPYFRALAEAWEAGRLMPVINTNLSEKDHDNAV